MRRPAAAIKKLQQEHRLITKAITAIEHVKAIRDQRGPWLTGSK
jgi:hypothetical protein